MFRLDKNKKISIQNFVLNLNRLDNLSKDNIFYLYPDTR